MDRLTNMEAFVRVVDAGSFSVAARNWGRSKAVVSKYVSALEVHLGVELLRRTTRSLSLTDAGRLYHGQCMELLGEIESLEASLREEHVAPRGLLRVTMPPGLMSRYQSYVTTDFVAKYPGVSMDIHLTHRRVDLIEEGFDVAIRVTEPRDSSLIARRLAPVSMLVVASPGYLASRGVPRSPAELRAHICLVDTNFREQGRWRFLVEGRVEVVEVKGPIRVNSPLIVKELAMQGHGIALISEFIVRDEIASGELVSVLDGMVGLDWSIYAMMPRRRHISGRVRAFVDHLIGGF